MLMNLYHTLSKVVNEYFKTEVLYAKQFFNEDRTLYYFFLNHSVPVHLNTCL